MTAKIALETLHQSYSKFAENRFTQVEMSQLVANSVDQDQTAPKEQSDLGLHCDSSWRVSPYLLFLLYIPCTKIF